MIKLSDIVMPWFKEKKFPLSVFASSNGGIWYFDLNCQIEGSIKGKLPVALGAIVDDDYKNAPYVVMLDTVRRPVSYLSPADPDFFTKLEDHINNVIKADNASR